MIDTASPYWTMPVTNLLTQFRSRPQGLTTQEADIQRAASGPNLFKDEKNIGPLQLLLRQYESPLLLVLLFGATLSLALKEWTDAAIIFLIVVASSLLGFYQEYRASTALAALRGRLALNSKLWRDGDLVTLPAASIVPGDVIRLSAGNLVPADGVILAATDFLVSEGSLTGESMPVEKRPGTSLAEVPVGQRTNCVFSGTSVRSGIADVLVVATGSKTELGGVAMSLGSAEPETEFARGVRQFGYLLIRVMIVMVFFVLIVSQLMGRPLIESLLFAVALAVGITPELLPAIVTVTLSAGARTMAKEGVIVRRLEALENLGSMDVLCTDKTGTLTEGTVTLTSALDLCGKPSASVLQLAFLNGSFETGIENPLDQAIIAAGQKASLVTSPYVKLDEIPYDFIRKRLTVVVKDPAHPKASLIITKGSFNAIMSICSTANVSGKEKPIDAKLKGILLERLERSGKDGFRVLAVASREVPLKADYGIADESDLTLEGFLLFADPPKADARQVVENLKGLGIHLKVITGDNEQVAVHVAKAIGLNVAHILNGPKITQLNDDALAVAADKADLFVEIDPQQKERIIRALQRRGHAVGYMGDGINDAPALQAADVGISVDSAVDVARQSADIVLLKQDLDVLRLGVESGRRTFANTLKYISITTCSNFGNMVSMALATPFLPFLPLLAKQILLNNFLSDIPSIAISTDNVDVKQAKRPERWNVTEVRRFMIIFGLVSSVFDGVTFLLLLKFFAAGESEFHTAWFVVSLLTEIAVVYSLRTRVFALKSRPGRTLIWASVAVSLAALTVPYLGPVTTRFGFVPLPLPVMIGLLMIVVTYLTATEITKYWFYKTARAKHPKPIKLQ